MKAKGKKKLELIGRGRGKDKRLEYCRACSKFETCETAREPDDIQLPRLCNDGLVQLAMEVEEKREKKSPIRPFVEVCNSGSVHVWIDAILANGKVMRINGGPVASQFDDKKITKKINQVLSRCTILPAASARRDYVRFGKPNFTRS